MRGNKDNLQLVMMIMSRINDIEETDGMESDTIISEDGSVDGGVEWVI